MALLGGQLPCSLSRPVPPITRHFPGRVLRVLTGSPEEREGSPPGGCVPCLPHEGMARSSHGPRSERSSSSTWIAPAGID